MDKKFVARGLVMGYDAGDIEGPIYRYFRKPDFQSAGQELGKHGHQMFEDVMDPPSPYFYILGAMRGLESMLLCLDLKEVGPNKNWTNIFDFRETYQEAVAREED